MKTLLLTTLAVLGAAPADNAHDELSLPNQPTYMCQDRHKREIYFVHPSGLLIIGRGINGNTDCTFFLDTTGGSRARCEEQVTDKCIDVGPSMEI